MAVLAQDIQMDLVTGQAGKAALVILVAAQQLIVQQRLQKCIQVLQDPAVLVEEQMMVVLAQQAKVEL